VTVASHLKIKTYVVKTTKNLFIKTPFQSSNNNEFVSFTTREELPKGIL